MVFESQNHFPQKQMSWKEFGFCWLCSSFRYQVADRTQPGGGWLSLESLLEPGWHRSIKLLRGKCSSDATFNEKERMTQRLEPWAQRLEPRITERGFETKGSLPSSISKLLGTSDLFFSLNFLPCLTEISRTVILCLYHHCVLEQKTC